MEKKETTSNQEIAASEITAPKSAISSLLPDIEHDDTLALPVGDVRKTSHGFDPANAKSGSGWLGGSEAARYAVVFCILLAIIGAAAAFYHWHKMPEVRAYKPADSPYQDVYARLGIAPLPYSVEHMPTVALRLDQLRREPCFRDAIFELSNSLTSAGYPRESATSLTNFVKRCPGSEILLTRAYNALLQISDLSGAKQVSDILIEKYPINPQYRYLRGRVSDQMGEFNNALNDYRNAVELNNEPKYLISDVFYNMARMYAALQRYCDAINPLETYISFDPIKRRTPQIMSIVADYAEKGHCAAHYASGTGRVSFLGNSGVHALPVTVNGVVGNFILDTGASYVSVSPQFASKSKINIENENQLVVKTAGGTAAVNTGYAASIAVGQAQAQGVVVAVLRTDEPFGKGVDGLLGMSFLARFKLDLSQTGIELSPLPLRQ